MRQLRRIHFVGIGGAGMSGLAEVLGQLGYEVSGSDIQSNRALQRLKKQGILLYQGHSAKVVQNADCVVYSSAIPVDNIERLEAERLGIPVVPRAQMLGELMRFKPGIAVSGTHGKTTTASMIDTVLTEAGLAPTCIIGGRLLEDRNLMGKGDYIVVEADESDASFLHLQPVIAVVTNIDNDHLESFEGQEQVLKEAFKSFLANLPFYGLAILCIDNPIVADIARQMKSPRVRTYGLSSAADVFAENITVRDSGMQFDMVMSGKTETMWIRAMGVHNVQNALVACIVAMELDVKVESIRMGLAAFSGVGRRMEEKGTLNLKNGSVLVIDDYAHHPTEITATLKALRLFYAHYRLLVVFQPHRYSRTARLLNDLAVSLSMADVLILTDIYAAGEEPPESDLEQQLFTTIPAHVQKIFCPWARLPDVINDIARTDDVVVTMGAGNIGVLADQLQKKVDHAI